MSAASSFAEFWPYYVRAHMHARTRLLHATGSVLAVAFLLLGLAVDLWFFVAAPIAGYAIAWYSHAYIEHNAPLTFQHPFYSLAADYRMLFLMMAGRMDAEVARCQLPGAAADQPA